MMFFLHNSFPQKSAQAQRAARIKQADSGDAVPVGSLRICRICNKTGKWSEHTKIAGDNFYS
jgi:hypothetical protein